MQGINGVTGLFSLIVLGLSMAAPVAADGSVDAHDGDRRRAQRDAGVQLGPRPFYLVKGMNDSPLKSKLLSCANGPFERSDFSIAHRGAPMQFPEHTQESYEAGARMGAGVVECDVTFTRDGELVCRHDECDLHTTTNIDATELNDSCSVPYSGPGSAPRCCASDLTLAQFRTLKGKMDASNPGAADAAGFLGGTICAAALPRGFLLCVRSAGPGRRDGQRHVQGTGCASARGGRPRHLF